MNAYSHRWHRPAELDAAPFSRVVADAQVIVAALTAQGLLLAGPDGDGEPILAPDAIALNGMAKCSHPPDYRISRVWPSDEAGGIAEPGLDVVAGQRGDRTLLSMRACTGSCNYQGLFLPRSLDLRYADEAGDGLFAGECATNFKPYDLAVTPILLSLKWHLGDAVRIFSDGHDGLWWDAKMLCWTLLGYGVGLEMSGGALVCKSQRCLEAEAD